MSSKFWKRINPFNNKAPAIYFIWAFIFAVIVFFALAVRPAKAETWVEGGATFLSSEYSEGAALFFSEVWDEKYLIGFGIVGDQNGKFSEKRITVKSNMVFHAQRLVTYKKVTLGIGIASWQHTDRALGDEFTFSLSLSVARPNRWWKWLPDDYRYRHFSNGGTQSPNSGYDIILGSYRF